MGIEDRTGVNLHDQSEAARTGMAMCIEELSGQGVFFGEQLPELGVRYLSYYLETETPPTTQDFEEGGEINPVAQQAESAVAASLNGDLTDMKSWFLQRAEDAVRKSDAKAVRDALVFKKLADGLPDYSIPINPPGFGFKEEVVMKELNRRKGGEPLL